MSTATLATPSLPARMPGAAVWAAPVAAEAHDAGAQARRIAAALARWSEALAPQRRLVHAGDVICRAGAAFGHLVLLNSGFVKVVALAPDGREQVAGLKFRGDWLGFDGIAGGRYTCDAVAMDTGEAWFFPYDRLLAACAREPALLGLLHEAMSREMLGGRSSMLSLCTLPADARVADFLLQLAESMAQRGLRGDQLHLRLTRAEIGSCLGMTLETASRALSRLVRCGVIEFSGRGRRDIRIVRLDALAALASGEDVAAATLQ